MNVRVGVHTLAALCGIAAANAAFAGYIGESFLHVADVSGGWPGDRKSVV